MLMNYYNQSTKAIIQQFHSSTKGLTSEQAQLNIQKFGNNIIKLSTKPWWRRLLEPLADVFMLILAAAAVISWHQGHVIDMAVILAVILINMIISYVQQYSTERILRSLNKQASQIVNVKRDGRLMKLDSEELAVGDMIFLAEGDKVPADGRIIKSDQARLDESMLTGESLPISKNEQVLAGTKQVYEQKNMIFSGSFLVSGSLTAIVTSVGMQTEFGKIASFTANTNQLSPVQQKINRLISRIIIVVVIVMIGIFGALLATGSDAETSLTFVLATTVSVVPEGLPVAITIILALSMRRMARENALIRNLRSIESIGLVNIIATDKTGTLTHNKLSIVNHWGPGGASKQFLTAIWGSMVPSENGDFSDPLDRAINLFIQQQKIDVTDYKLIKALTFNQTLILSGAVYQTNSGYEVFIKGSPEKIIALARLKTSAKVQAETMLREMIDEGGRVIGIARAKLTEPIDSLDNLPKKIEFMGMIELSDPLRPEAKFAVTQAQQAGIKVVMITGDHYRTALGIGRQLGIAQDESEVMDMSQVSDFTSQEFISQASSCSVFARVTPEAKFRILEILKRDHILAMTGDGVNDTPALIEANMGIAMGSGSSIAKDASDMIILDDNFNTIVTAVKEGRTTVHNIRRVMFYLLSTNLGELLTFITALILRLPLPLAAVQILWINLVTDTAFVIPLGLQPAQDNIMKAKPKSPTAPLLNRSYLIRIGIVSLVMMILALAAYQLYASKGVAYAQTMAFTVLVVCQWANAFNATSFSLSLFDPARKRNRLMKIILLLSIALHIFVIYGPIGNLLKLTAVNLTDLAFVSLVSGLATVLIIEIHKIINRWIYYQPFYR